MFFHRKRTVSNKPINPSRQSSKDEKFLMLSLPFRLTLSPGTGRLFSQKGGQNNSRRGGADRFMGRPPPPASLFVCTFQTVMRSAGKAGRHGKVQLCIVTEGDGGRWNLWLLFPRIERKGNWGTSKRKIREMKTFSGLGGGHPGEGAPSHPYSLGRVISFSSLRPNRFSLLPRLYELGKKLPRSGKRSLERNYRRRMNCHEFLCSYGSGLR